MLRQIMNKKGEIGETITWMIATIIIIVIILVSVFFVSVISKSNELKKPNFYEEVNIYSAENSLISYALTKDETTGKIIYDELLNKSFSTYSGSFAVDVFKNKIYNNYSKVWVGFGSESSNDYFGLKTIANDFVSKIKLKNVDEFELRLKK